MSLFPTPQRNNHLVQFYAGKCIREGNLIKPDTRKGIVYMDQSDDQLMHFYWKERKASTPEDDFIIFPDEAELIPVTQCTTGRVYVLKFKSSSQKIFYWMQNKNEENDKEVVDRVNKLINDPSSATNDSDDFEDMNMTQDNLMQFLQNAEGLSDLSHELYAAKWMDVQTMLSELTVPEGKTSSSLDLSEVLTAEVLNPILGDAVIRETLFPFVNHSREERSPQEIEELVSSQQFKERLQLLNYALERDVLTAIIEALDSEKNLKSFLKATSEHAKHRQNKELEGMDED